MILRLFSLATLTGLVFASSSIAEAATIALSPRTDCRTTYVGTYNGKDIYEAYCHFSGTVTFTDPNHSLYRVECTVGNYLEYGYAGFQGGAWNHDGGANVYGYSQCSDYQPQYTWGSFFDVYDTAYMVVGEQLSQVAEDHEPWCPGATL